MEQHPNLTGAARHRRLCTQPPILTLNLTLTLILTLTFIITLTLALTSPSP